MKTLKIMFDIFADPLWFEDDDLTVHEELIKDKIESDSEIMELCALINDLFTSYYNVTSDRDPSEYFDYEMEKATKDIMLDYLIRLRKRIDEINDGTFRIDDWETDRLRYMEWTDTSMTKEEFIRKEIEAVFSIGYFSDAFDDKVAQRGHALMHAFSWEEIYPILRDYVYEHGNTFEDLVSYVNFFFFFHMDLHDVPDAYEFASFFMYRWDIRELWYEGGKKIEWYIVCILHRAGAIKRLDYDKYIQSPYVIEDEILNAHIAKRKRDRQISC